jgi:hypothetical protein
VLTLAVAAALPMAAGAQDQEVIGEIMGVGTNLDMVDLGIPHYNPVRSPAHETIPPEGIGLNFRLLDHNPLIDPASGLPIGGGGNDFNIVRDCGYATAKNNDQGIWILDISDPTDMQVVKMMEPLPNAPSGASVSNDHAGTVESENLLVQVAENGAEPWDGNFFELWDTTDCRNPVLAHHEELPDTPHDPKDLWVGGDPHTVLLLLAFNDREDNNPFPPAPHDIDIRIYDVTDKYNPKGLIAEYSYQREFGLPVHRIEAFYEGGGETENYSIHDATISGDPEDLNEAGFPTRIYTASYDLGWPILDSTALADMLAGGPACDSDPAGPNPCIKKLNPLWNVGGASNSPPFNQYGGHSAYKVPGRPYMVMTGEPGTCPWAWIRFAYVGPAFNSVADGELFPGEVGSFRIPENREYECPENEQKFAHDVSGDESFNPHLSLVFPNIMFISWNNAGIRAIDISDPGMPFELGFFFPPPAALVSPTGMTAAGDQWNLSLNNPPTLKDGVFFIRDRVNGVYSFEYVGPRADEVPTEGLYQGEQVQVPGRYP